MSDTTIISQIVHINVPDTADLALMTTSMFTAHKAATNEAYNTTLLAYEDACQALGDLLTEDIARHIAVVHPTAALLIARPAADFCPAADGSQAGDCAGHATRLIGAYVADANGVPVGTVDGLDPVNFWLERLTPLLGAVEVTLTVASREWSFAN